MHRLADVVASAVDIRLIHIADATAAAAVKAAGVDVVALLGTRYTMEQDFYVGRLRELHGLTVLIPNEPDRVVVHDVIYQELVRGITSRHSKSQYLDIIERLLGLGAQGVIAGCTEIELLISPEDLPVPLFPTAYLHAVAAAEFALAE
jgi:aspartate racemase